MRVFLLCAVVALSLPSHVEGQDIRWRGAVYGAYLGSGGAVIQIERYEEASLSRRTQSSIIFAPDVFALDIGLARLFRSAGSTLRPYVGGSIGGMKGENLFPLIAVQFGMQLDGRPNGRIEARLLVPSFFPALLIGMSFPIGL